MKFSGFVITFLAKYRFNLYFNHVLKIDNASHKLSFEQYAILINAKQISFHFLHLSPDGLCCINM